MIFTIVVLTALSMATVVFAALIFLAVAANAEYIQYATSLAAVATSARLAAEISRDDGRRGRLIYYRRNKIAYGYNRGFARIVCYA